MFPSALTSSVSSLLLPSVSELQAQGNNKRIRKTIYLTIGFCSLLGIMCFLFFFIFADFIGELLFHSSIAASQIRALSFVCPFFIIFQAHCAAFFMDLEKQALLFAFNMISIFLRLGFVYFVIPLSGFSGYLYGILCSQILFDFLIILALKQYLIYDKM